MNGVYKIVFFICLVLSGVLCFHMAYTTFQDGKMAALPDFRPPVKAELRELEPEQIPQTLVEMSQEDLQDLIWEYVPEALGVKSFTVELSSKNGGTVSLEAELSKSALISYLEQGGSKMDASIKSSLIFLPEDIRLHAEFTAACDGNSGLLMLTPQKLMIGKLELPDHMLGASELSAVNRCVNDALVGSGILFRQVEISDNSILFKS